MSSNSGNNSNVAAGSSSTSSVMNLNAFFPLLLFVHEYCLNASVSCAKWEKERETKWIKTKLKMSKRRSGHLAIKCWTQNHRILSKVFDVVK